MSRASGLRTTKSSTAPTRSRTPALKEPQQSTTRGRSSRATKPSQTNAQDVKVAFNEALASLSRASKEKPDLKTLNTTIEQASNSVKTLRERAKVNPDPATAAAQSLSIDQAASALCGCLIDIKAFDQAKIELTLLTQCLRSRLGLEKGDLKWPFHLAIPLNQSAVAPHSANTVLLVVTTQLHILATVLRPAAHTTSDWTALASDLTSALDASGHPLEWRAHLFDAIKPSEHDERLERVDKKLSSFYATILKTTAGVDSSSSTAAYDPDALLKLRLYGVACGLFSPSLSHEAQDEAVRSARESFWDECRRVFGYYIRSVTTLKCASSAPLEHQGFGQIIRDFWLTLVPEQSRRLSFHWSSICSQS